MSSLREQEKPERCFGERDGKPCRRRARKLAPRPISTMEAMAGRPLYCVQCADAWDLDVDEAREVQTEHAAMIEALWGYWSQQESMSAAAAIQKLLTERDVALVSLAALTPDTTECDRFRAALQDIAEQDYRGNRPWSATRAHQALHPEAGR